MMMKHGVTSLTTSGVRAGTHLAVSLHLWNVAEGETGMTETCVISSTAKMHATGSKTGVRIVSALNKSDVKRGTMTTVVLIMTNLTDNILPMEVTMQEESRPFPTT
jgi:hypothetical protein